MTARNAALIARALALVTYLSLLANASGHSAGCIVGIVIAVCYLPAAVSRWNLLAWRFFFPMAIVAAIHHQIAAVGRWREYSLFRLDVPFSAVFVAPVIVLVALTVVAHMRRRNTATVANPSAERTPETD